MTIESQETEVIGFALVAALDSVRLMTHADAARSFWDNVVVLDIEKKEGKSWPTQFALNQNYPNPFNAITTIKFSLPKTDFVTLDIYNPLGQLISTLVADKLNAGNHSYKWDASSMASGVYYYRLQAGEYVDTKKLVFLK